MKDINELIRDIKKWSKYITDIRVKRDVYHQLLNEIDRRSYHMGQSAHRAGWLATVSIYGVNIKVE